MSAVVLCSLLGHSSDNKVQAISLFQARGPYNDSFDGTGDDTRGLADYVEGAWIHHILGSKPIHGATTTKPIMAADWSLVIDYELDLRYK
jgi:hypothetical protein